jgi:hypothetical protein
VPEAAFINESGADDRDVAFAVKALDAQLREDFCPLRPGKTYQPVNFYANPRNLPVASGLSIIFSIVDKLDSPGLAAYHSWAGVPFVKIDRNQGVLSVLGSHENLEESDNPRCDKTFLMPDGTTAAWEVCDPVQGWTYTKRVYLFGEGRDVEVSAFVTPAWFYGEAGPTYFCPGRTDELAPKAIAPGGYVPVMKNGVWDAIFGYAVTPEQQAVRRAKWAANETSRAFRRAA